MHIHNVHIYWTKIIFIYIFPLLLLFLLFPLFLFILFPLFFFFPSFLLFVWIPLLLLLLFLLFPILSIHLYFYFLFSPSTCLYFFSSHYLFFSHSSSSFSPCPSNQFIIQSRRLKLKVNIYKYYKAKLKWTFNLMMKFKVFSLMIWRSCF